MSESLLSSNQEENNLVKGGFFKRLFSKRTHSVGGFKDAKSHQITDSSPNATESIRMTQNKGGNTNNNDNNDNLLLSNSLNLPPPKPLDHYSLIQNTDSQETSQDHSMNDVKISQQELNEPFQEQSQKLFFNNVQEKNIQSDMSSEVSSDKNVSKAFENGTVFIDDQPSSWSEEEYPTSYSQTSFSEPEEQPSSIDLLLNSLEKLSQKPVDLKESDSVDDSDVNAAAIGLSLDTKKVDSVEVVGDNNQKHSQDISEELTTSSVVGDVDPVVDSVVASSDASSVESLDSSVVGGPVDSVSVNFPVDNSTVDPVDEPVVSAVLVDDEKIPLPLPPKHSVQLESQTKASSSPLSQSIGSQAPEESYLSSQQDVPEYISAYSKDISHYISLCKSFLERAMLPEAKHAYNELRNYFLVAELSDAQKNRVHFKLKEFYEKILLLDLEAKAKAKLAQHS